MFELTPFISNRRRAMNVYDPFRELNELENAFFGGTRCAFCSDITDNGDSYTIETDLPGMKKEDISIDITGDTMTVSAERHANTEEKDKKNNYVRIERSYGSYKRSFDISEVNADAITAKYEDGVLTLNLPKKVPAKPESRKLDIA